MNRLKSIYPSHKTNRLFVSILKSSQLTLSKTILALVWTYCCQVFDFLNLAANIEGSIFCVHGGIAQNLTIIDDIQVLQRSQEIPKEGAFADLMWSDPDETIEEFRPSARGAGSVFGEVATKSFLRANGMDLIARSHQLVNEVYF